LQLDDLRVKYVIPHFFVVQVFVNKPGNLSSARQVARLNQMVEDFEMINGSWGTVGTKYFMRDYIDFEDTLNNGVRSDDFAESVARRSDIDMEDLPSFFQSFAYSYWRGFVRLSNGTDSQK
jgi:hypothetical protein